MQDSLEKDMFIKISKGDESAYETLFRAYFAELTIYAFRFLEDMENAEETVQDIYFNLWTNRESLSITTSIKSYLYRTVKNTCLNHLKHQKVEDKYKNYFGQQIQLDELRHDDWMTNNELTQSIEKAIESMPTMRKKVFCLSKINKLKYKEIAEDLGISIKTVENHMGKALKYLRTELADLLPILLLIFLAY